MESDEGDGEASFRPMSSFQPASTLPRPPAPAQTTSASTSRGVIQPRPRPQIRGAVGSGNTILVNNCQRGNPLLPFIRHIGWSYSDIIPDYQVGLTTCILFLSIRYHRLHPEYIHSRITKLGTKYTLRILLLHIDTPTNYEPPLKELTKLALLNNLTLILAWSSEEAAKYVETFKSFEHKPPDSIQHRVATDYTSQITNVLTQIRGVNKTDVVTLLTRFGSFKGVVRAQVDEIATCPGFGLVKATRVKEVMTQPFRVGETRRFKDRVSTTTEDQTSTSTDDVVDAEDMDEEERRQLELALQMSLNPEPSTPSTP